ncbi:hypothetical protein [Agrobacterium sp. SUL3]|uniref:hypothetical protein n=1 Tax=Agrobacterium sp. SUL3 TaxID=1701910 RepID=UPI00069986C0|nr:hypothetical protein [Agrobacterium sp. SUL3]KNY35576.1 hypothetical protein AKG12_00610 [Agrobacterium sp. SUL3]
MDKTSNSTTVPAVSTGNDISFESLIARLNTATTVANSLSVPLEETPEEVELHAAVDAIAASQAKLVSYDGVMQALRLAVKENENYQGSDVSVAAVAAALDFLEERETELPVERVERLAVELSEVLPHWANGQFMAIVHPAGDPRGHWFRNARDEDSKPVDPIARLREITNEAAMLIATNPDMKIDHVTVDKDGIYTGLVVSGLAVAPQDPLLDTIKGFRDGLAAFSAIPGDQITGANEDGLVEATYGRWLVKLDDWDEPAGSVEGAIEAIKLMQDQDVFVDVVGKSMARAVLSFLEGVRA